MELYFNLPRNTKDKKFKYLEGESFYTLGIIAVLTEELKSAKKISLQDFEKASRIYHRQERKKRGRLV